jgi:hypothetical protein
MTGAARAKIRKYEEASPAMSSLPPRRQGSGPERIVPTTAIRREKRKQTTIPSWRSCLAFSSLPAPMYCKAGAAGADEASEEPGR